MEIPRHLTRRQLLSILGATTGAILSSACQPAPRRLEDIVREQQGVIRQSGIEDPQLIKSIFITRRGKQPPIVNLLWIFNGVSRATEIDGGVTRVEFNEIPGDESFVRFSINPKMVIQRKSQYFELKSNLPSQDRVSRNLRDYVDRGMTMAAFDLSTTDRQRIFG